MKLQTEIEIFFAGFLKPIVEDAVAAALRNHQASSTNSPQAEEKPIKIDQLVLDLDTSRATIYNLQRQGIITPHRFPGSTSTYYYLSEVKAAMLTRGQNKKRSSIRQQKAA